MDCKLEKDLCDGSAVISPLEKAFADIIRTTDFSWEQYLYKHDFFQTGQKYSATAGLNEYFMSSLS